MRRNTWACGLPLLATAILVAMAWAQEPKTTAAPKPEAKVDKPAAAQPQEQLDPKMAEMMKKWMEYATPGQPHKNLEPLAGKWEYTMKWWMDPQAEPDTCHGTSEHKLIFEGRYLQSSVVSPPKDDMGEFRGMCLMGYDNLKKEYESVWLDNMSSGLLIGRGKVGADPTVIELSGTMSNP